MSDNICAWCGELVEDQRTVLMQEKTEKGYLHIHFCSRMDLLHWLRHYFSMQPTETVMASDGPPAE